MKKTLKTLVRCISLCLASVAACWLVACLQQEQESIPSEEERCSYYPVLDADPNDATSYTAAFNTLRFKDDNDITLRIHANESRVIAHEFSLADFLDENNIAVEGVHEVTIPILIRFSPIGVEIIDWDTAPVIPDFDKD